MTTPPKLLGLDHVVLRVRDLDAALRFYVGMLGCSEERRIDQLGLVRKSEVVFQFRPTR